MNWTENYSIYCWLRNAWPVWLVVGQALNKLNNKNNKTTIYTAQLHNKLNNNNKYWKQKYTSFTAQTDHLISFWESIKKRTKST